MGVITGERILGYKLPEVEDLDERGLMRQFSEPLRDNHPEEKAVLHSMMETAERAGTPYVLTRIVGGYAHGEVILWKERKAIRCHKCGNFLNARPPRYKPIVTHRQLGMKCAASG